MCRDGVEALYGERRAACRRGAWRCRASALRLHQNRRNRERSEILGLKRPSSGWDDSPARSRKAVWERDEQCSANPHGLRVLWGGVSRAIGRKPVVAGSAASVIKRDAEGAKRRGLLGYAMRSRMHRPMRRPAGAPCLLREARGASGGVRATAPPAGASESKNRHLRIAGVGSGGCRKGQRGGAGSWGGGSGREARIFCSGQGRAGDDDTDEFYSSAVKKSVPPRAKSRRPGGQRGLSGK